MLSKTTTAVLVIARAVKLKVHIQIPYTHLEALFVCNGVGYKLTDEDATGLVTRALHTATQEGEGGGGGGGGGVKNSLYLELTFMQLEAHELISILAAFLSNVYLPAL